MPFDGLPAGWLEDIAKLRVALDGVRGKWIQSDVGAGDEHCAVGWLLVATDWDAKEATRLALEYVYPALPEGVRNPTSRVDSIWRFNDRCSHKRMVRLFTDAVDLAEQRVR